MNIFLLFFEVASRRLSRTVFFGIWRPFGAFWGALDEILEPLGALWGVHLGSCGFPEPSKRNPKLREWPKRVKRRGPGVIWGWLGVPFWSLFRCFFNVVGLLLLVRRPSI